MAGIGDEMGGMVISGAGKTAQLIGQLLEAILRRQLSKQKTVNLDEKIGLVSARKMRATGEPTANWGMYVTEKGMRELSSTFRREGIVFSGFVDKYRRDDLGAKDFYVVTVFQKDLEKALRAVERYNAETRYNDLDQQRMEILSKKDITKVATLRACIDEMDKIQRDNCDILNREMDVQKIHEIMGEVVDEKREVLDISKALDANTGRVLDKDRFSVIADIHAPDKIIICHGQNDRTPDGSTYVKTDYTVSDGLESQNFTDGYVNGRKEPWTDTKAKIIEAADFSGDFYKFATMKEYEKWKDKLKNLDSLEQMRKPHESRDYESIIKKLNEERAGAEDSVVIAKQINVCERIQEYDSAYRFARVQSLTAEPGSLEQKEGESKMAEIEKEMGAAQKEYDKLLSERESLNARSVREPSKGENPHAQDERTQEILKGRTLDQYKEAISEVRRSERGNERGNERGKTFYDERGNAYAKKGQERA